MLVHVVMWRLQATAANESRESLAAELVVRLRALAACVEGLIDLEAGQHRQPPSEDVADVVLVTRFRDDAALRAYLAHPGHQELAAWLAPRRAERRVVDYCYD